MIRYRLCAVLLFWGGCWVQLGAAEAQLPAETDHDEVSHVSYWYRNYDTRASYALLDLALSKTTDLYGSYKITRSPVITQGRAVLELQSESSGTIRVINVVPDLNREKNLIPVRIATDEGLVGFRVCIINEADRDKFKGIRSHKDIAAQGIVFGQGLHWPDTYILRENALPVVTSAQYENLYPMLKSGRYHCFLRGINEAIADLATHPDEGLMIEPGLLFAYPSVSLLFVRRSDKIMAARLELGLRRAILDGSYAKYFAEEYFADLSLLNLGGRRIIRLNNPLLEDSLLTNIGSKLIFSDGKLQVY
ncbi:MAG: hypothetical protein WCY88_07145 [Spongiibacteraceae bacterium]